ncbi:hypothetical protein B566_EDAN006009 [Ephemera danica]|nr:hypothetical protein B566_EDAN006009 [Ephemera danica]
MPSTTLNQAVPDDDPALSSENSMRLDSGECGNLSEHFSELNLKSHLNDLNAAPRTISTSDSSRTSNIISPSSKPTQVVSTPAPSIQQQQQQSQIDAHFDYQYFVQDEDGDTQLHLAILQGFIEVVYGLIRMAPEPNWLDVPNDLHQTPMHLAVLTAQAPIVRALLVAGASPDSRDRHGNTPLHLASMHGATDCVRALLQPIAVSETLAAGLRYNPAAMLINNTAAIIDEPNYDGQLCVHLAAAEGHVDALRHLEGKLGRTPLHVAAERGRRRISLYLLQECPAVDLTLVTFAGYTAYQLAQYGDPTLARELANRGAAIRAHLDSSSSEESDSEEEEIFGHLPTEGFYRRAIVA